MKLRDGSWLEVGRVFNKDGLFSSGEFKDGKLVRSREIEDKAHGLINLINGKLTVGKGGTIYIGQLTANGELAG